MAKPKPTNPSLYSKAKAKYSDMKHSAHKSQLIVKEYKRLGGKYSGNKEEGGLTRWGKEDWRNQRGEKGYKKKGDIYRPTKKISKDTPATHKELTEAEKKRAMKEKKETGKVKRFKKKKSNEKKKKY